MNFKDVITRLSSVHELIESDASGGIKIWKRGDPVPEEILAYIKKVTSDVDEAVKQCSSHGKGLILKTGKPKNGVYAYVWRMARYHSGDDPKMPITATFDLEEELEKMFKIRMSFAITTDQSEVVIRDLDMLADKVLVKLGRDKNEMAKRFGRALGYF